MSTVTTTLAVVLLNVKSVSSGCQMNGCLYQLPDAVVLDLHEHVFGLEVSFPVRQQLGEVEERHALREQLGDHTAWEGNGVHYG